MLTFVPYWRKSWRWNACATSSSQPFEISGIHSSREASAASMGKAVGDGGWGAAPGAGKAVAALGLGIGSGAACRGLQDRYGPRRGHSFAEDISQLLEVGCLGRGEDRRGEDDQHEDQESLRAGGRQF